MIINDIGDRLLLEEPWDFTSLAFATDKSAGTAIGGVRWVGEGHVDIPVDRLRSLAGELADDEEWRSSFDAMIEYATGKGWVDVARNVRIHVVDQRR